MSTLGRRESVTKVAFELGYERGAGCTVMFRRAFGNSPLAYLRWDFADPFIALHSADVKGANLWSRGILLKPLFETNNTEHRENQMSQSLLSY